MAEKEDLMNQAATIVPSSSASCQFRLRITIGEPTDHLADIKISRRRRTFRQVSRKQIPEEEELAEIRNKFDVVPRSGWKVIELSSGPPFRPSISSTSSRRRRGQGSSRFAPSILSSHPKDPIKNCLPVLLLISYL